MAVAAYLRGRPDVAEVRYPGFGGMVSFLAAPSGSRSPGERAVDPALVRLSVGIEGVDDLIADLRQALDGASALGFVTKGGRPTDQPLSHPVEHARAGV